MFVYGYLGFYSEVRMTVRQLEEEAFANSEQFQWVAG